VVRTHHVFVRNPGLSFILARVRSIPPQRFRDVAESGLCGFGLSTSDCARVLRFDPLGKLDSIGFFAAKFIKRH
jgi:hypothetical protein